MVEVPARRQRQRSATNRRRHRASAERRRAVRVLQQPAARHREIDVPESSRRPVPAAGRRMSPFGHEAVRAAALRPGQARSPRDATIEVFLRPLPWRSGARTYAGAAADPEEHGLGEPSGLPDREQIRRWAAAVPHCRAPGAPRDRALPHPDVRVADAVLQSFWKSCTGG